MQIAIVLLISLILSDIIYTIFKKKNGKAPSGKYLFLVLIPILGFILSLLFYSDDIIIFIKNFVLCTIIVGLIPVNIVCLKNGIVRTGSSAKNTFKEGKKIIKDEKKDFEDIKDSMHHKD